MRSALVWTLTAAFLVTLPVTGGGQCPCRFVNALRTPTVQPVAFIPAASLKCNCCHEPRRGTAPDHPDDDHQKPTPINGPCGHQFTVDATATGGAGERLEQSRNLWDANPVVDAGGYAASHLATDAVAISPEPTLASRPCAHFRYAHSFRC
jgi:hypothetical protein